MSDMLPILATYKDGALYILGEISEEELMGKELRVIIVDHASADESRKQKLKQIMIKLRDSSAFSDVADLIEWQKKERDDRELFSGQ